MSLLNGEIAYSSDQRNNSYIFVDLVSDLDSANTLMTTSDAAKLGIRCKLLAWIRYYLVRSKANQRLSVKCQGRVSGAHKFLKWHPEASVMPGFIFYFNIIVKHPIHPEFPPRVTATSYVYAVLLATSKDHVQIIQQALCTINDQCK